MIDDIKYIYLYIYIYIYIRYIHCIIWVYIYIYYLEGLRPGTATMPIWDPARQGTAQGFSFQRPVGCRILAGSPAGISTFVL